MKTTPIQIRFDANKLNALNCYLPMNGKTVEEELQNHLAELYEQEVPDNVKQFIKFQSGEETDMTESEQTDETKPAKRQRQSSPKAEAATETPVVASAPALTM